MPFGDYPDRQPDVGQGDRPRQLDRRRDQARRSRAASCATARGCCRSRWTGRRSPTMTPDDLTRSSRICARFRRCRTRCRAPTRPFLPSYLWGKFKMLILGDDPPIVIFPGNAGARGGRSMKRFLKWAALVVVLLLVGRLRRVPLFHPAVLHRRRRRRSRSRMIDAAPASPTSPIRRSARSPSAAATSSSRAAASAATRPTARRARTTEISGRRRLKFHTPKGTFVSRNLTPDKTTGLGRRSDDEVKRVLRSGVIPDGRVTSYRLMPWGAFSNWTDEDRHAVRRLPASSQADRASDSGPGRRPLRWPIPSPSRRSTAARITARRPSSAARESTAQHPCGCACHAL